MTEEVVITENILSANDQIALANRALLDNSKTLGINVMASPGAGKTTTILATARRLKEEFRLGVIEGDLASSIDTDKALSQGVPAIQINTGGGCHLEAHQTQAALNQLDLNALDIVLIENVGNLVCPTWWDLGQHKRIVIASVPEGDDKPYKYPVMYRGIDALLLNKTDLLPYIDFDVEYFSQGVKILNPDAKIFQVSAKTGDGMDPWIDWLRMQVKAING